MATNMGLISVLVFACTGVAYVAAESCYAMQSYFSGGYLQYRTTSTYCYSSQYCCSGIYYASCCDTYYDSYDYYTYYNVLSAGTIAGIVVGGLIGLGVLISIIVCICCVCARNKRPGQVITTTPTSTTFTVASQQMASPNGYPTQAMYPQHMQPGIQPGIQASQGGYNPAYTSDGPPSYDEVTKPTSPPPPVGFIQ